MMILLVNACVRAESRTKRLAACLLSKLGGTVTEHRLTDAVFPSVDEGFLRRRDDLIKNGEFDDSLFRCAREFAEADIIVIAAPYWDLSFPAVLKQYFEQINVLGITFRYSPEGVPVGLCKAKQLYYVTTAGGNYVPMDFGFGYVKELAYSFYGISDVRLIKAVGLDIDNAKEDEIVSECIKEIEESFGYDTV